MPRLHLVPRANVDHEVRLEVHSVLGEVDAVYGKGDHVNEDPINYFPNGGAIGLAYGCPPDWTREDPDYSEDFATMSEWRWTLSVTDRLAALHAARALDGLRAFG